MQSESLFHSTIDECTQKLCDAIAALSLDEQVDALNKVRSQLHKVSPFRNEPIDYVVWLKSELIQVNDYNPNHVAIPEFKSLRRSVEKFGYGMPIITARAIAICSTSDVLLEVLIKESIT